MNKFASIITDSMIYIVDTESGNDVKFFDTDPQFQTALEYAKEGDYDAIFDLDVKTVIKKFCQWDKQSSVKITIENGEGFVYLTEHNLTVPLHDVITSRIITMVEQDFDPQPLLNFIGNLYANPSKTAVEELFLFLNACNLPITEDGHFIAYKIVRNDYKDKHSGTFDNSIGQIYSMPRNAVDDDRNKTCSAGLHFCSKGYISSFGTFGDKCMLVKINPADVVSIPSDYNNAKGRTWKYEVVGELPYGWLNTLPYNDYTDKAVVGDDGQEIDDDEGYDEGYDDDDEGYYDDDGKYHYY